MAEQRSFLSKAASATPWIVVWLMVAGLVGEAIFLMHQYEKRRFRILADRWEDTWRNRLPLLEHRLSRIHLAEELLITSTVGITTLDRVSVNRLTTRLAHRFGSRVSYVICDKNGTILSSSGIPQLLGSIVARIIQGHISVENLDLLGETIRAMAIGDFNRQFPNHEAWSIHANNWADVCGIRLGQENGLALYCLFPTSDRFDFSRRKWKMIPQARAAFFDPGFSGGIVAHVPLKSLDRAWIRDSLRRFPGVAECRTALGRPEKILRTSGLPSMLREEIHRKLRERNGGVVCRDGWIAGFLRPPFQPDHLFLISRRLPPDRSWNRTLVASIAGMTLLFFAGLALIMAARAGRTAPPPLAGKYLFLLLLTIGVPTIGFIRLTGTLREEARALGREEAFKNLEERLERAENSYIIATSDFFAELKRFLAWIDVTPALPHISEIQNWLTGRPHLRFNLAYFADSQGAKPTIIEQSQAHQSDFLLPLMNRLARSAGYLPATHGKADAGKEATEEMILDIAQSIIGSDELYRTFNRLDQIVAFRFYFDVGWVFLHIAPPTTVRSGRFSFFTLDLDDSQENAAFTSIRERPIDHPPGLTIAPRSRRQNLYMPDRASRIPIIRRVFSRVLQGGGIQKAAFLWKGRPYLLLARPMRNMDMVGAAIIPSPAAPAIDPLSMITVGYPLLIGLLVFFLFRRFYLQPIVLLGKGVDGIASGDYSQRVPIMTDDEIGSLCRGFNTMAESLAEKEYLRRFLSDLAMSAVTSGSEGQAAVRSSGAVLFSDIRGFTTLSEKHSPEAIVAMLNLYFTVMEEAIELQGGSIEKFIGDAIMAVFLPMHGRPHPSLRAVKAAAQMREALALFNLQRAEQGVFEIATGIGIASGDLLLGALGRPDGRRDFTVTGPTVNLASAMEKRSKEGTRSRIILCQQTARHLASRRLSPLPPTAASPAWELMA